MMEFFKHDISACDDDKLCELLATGGYELLGYYWRFIEYLYGRNGKVNKDKLKGVAWSLHMEYDKLKSVIYDFGLFAEDEEYIYSKRVVSEIEEFEEVGKRMSSIGRAGGRASAEARAKRKVKRTVEEIQADGQPLVEIFEADAQQKKRKKKKKKENKRKESVCDSAHAQTKYYGKHENVELTEAEYQSIPNRDEAISFFSEYLNGLKNPYPKKHYYALTTWVQEALSERKAKKGKTESEDSFTVEQFVEAALKKSGY